MNYLDGSRVLETRKRNGMVWRRYVTKDGTKVTTYEVPTSVIKSHGLKATQVLLDKARQTYDRSARTEYVKKRLAEGWKPAAIAHEVGLTEARIRQIRKEMKDVDTGR